MKPDLLLNVSEIFDKKLELFTFKIRKKTFFQTRNSLKIGKFSENNNLIEHEKKHLSHKNRNNMNLRRIIGILICIGGIALIFLSNYIAKQVEEGKEKISNAQNKVEQGKTLFGQNPVSKEIGQKIFFDSAEEKINAGKEEVAEYEQMSNHLMVGGIALLLIGAIIIVIPRRKKN